MPNQPPSTGSLDLIASQVLAQLKIPDLAADNSTESFLARLTWSFGLNLNQSIRPCTHPASYIIPKSC